VELITAASTMVEMGDLRRFDNPRQVMGYLGLVSGERSTGAVARQLS
jgi:transposase